MAQYRFQEDYYERLRQQRMRLENEHHDYDHDPYYYTAPSYRYNRGGRYYQTNQYGADLLRQAVNNGYQEGFRAGQADRQDRWRSNYRDSYAYQDANYGYSGYYVAQDDYNYYFREGFRRGYEDGYNSRYRYGRYSNGSYSILGAILSQILGLQPLG
jgi:flagellar biosynthesis/type III secretory pathway protein FliH